MMEAPQFDPRDRTWAILKEYLREHIELHRDSLENKALAEDSTQFVRGSLAAFRHILSLEQPPVNLSR